MLHDFIAANRDAIILRTRELVASRPWPAVSPSELEHGVPPFPMQLAETPPVGGDRDAISPGRHRVHCRASWRRVVGSWLYVTQVVHDYGDARATAGRHVPRRNSRDDVLHSVYQCAQFTVEPVNPDLALDGDSQMLALAVMNLLHNAFKSTPAGGGVGRYREVRLNCGSTRGEMSEWLKEHAWKACVGETLPWVRIPLSPPTSLADARWRFEWSPGFARLASLAALGTNPTLSAEVNSTTPNLGIVKPVAVF